MAERRGKYCKLTHAVYVNPDAGERYGKSFMRRAVRETTRTWFPFPYNKLYIRDEAVQQRPSGGRSDQYIYRLAGRYPLRAEAHYGMGSAGRAVANSEAACEPPLFHERGFLIAEGHRPL